VSVCAQLSVDALIEERKKLAYTPALTELASDIRLVHSALQSSKPAAIASNPYAKLTSPYAFKAAYIMAEIDHFHALTPPPETKVNAFKSGMHVCLSVFPLTAGALSLPLSVSFTDFVSDYIH
jgi:hypothetical protein